MEIQITEKYVMTSDAQNFILNEVIVGKAGKSEGKRRLKPVGFYNSVSDLCEAVISKHLKASTNQTMKGLLHEHTRLVDDIRRLFHTGITGIGTMPCSECEANRNRKRA